MIDIAAPQQEVQLPLIHIVDNDDRILAQTLQATWFPIMRDLDWRAYKEIAVRYYEALYRFNVAAAQRRGAATTQPVNDESKEQARLRLLFDRPTMGNETRLCSSVPQSAQEILHVNADEIAPAGPCALLTRGQDFFALLRSYWPRHHGARSRT